MSTGLASDRQAPSSPILRGAAAEDHEIVRTLREHVGKEIGPIAKPKIILVVPELPKTRSGKIMRHLLQDLAEGREAGDSSTLADAGIMDTITESLKKGVQR